MDKSATVATAHAYGSFVLGLLWALRSDRPHRAAAAAAYLTGSEVLWRMTETATFWEYGKYAVALLLLAWMVRTGSFRSILLPATYLLLLVPSMSVTLSEADPATAKRMISFNVSGPFALAAATMFFQQARFTRRQLGSLLLVCAAPIVAVLTVALTSTVSSSRLLFTNNSNWETSGGFGPNQVSAVLGLGALLLFLFLVVRRPRAGTRALLFLLLVAFAAQSALTFSRGGLYNAFGAGCLGTLFLLRGAGARGRAIVMVALVTLAAWFLLFPRLDEFSNGQLSKRFQTTHTSGRDVILLDDLSIWDRNVLFGVGPGRARFNRTLLHSKMAAHTEWSRLLAEHGVFGLVSGVLLIGMGLHRVLRARSAWGQATAATAVAWAFLYMLHAAMRLAAPAFVFGLASATFVSDGEAEEREEEEGDGEDDEDDEDDEDGEEGGDLPPRLRGRPFAGRVRE
jgi:hypothetical protein